MKKIIVIIGVCLMVFPAFSQSEISLFFGSGVNKMSGDIGGDNWKSLLQNDLGMTTSFGVRYTLPRYIGFRIFGDYAKYNGKDTKLYNGNRLLAFTSTVFGIGAQVEYIAIGGTYLDKGTPHSLYFFGGGSSALVKPTLEDVALEREKTGAFFAGAGYQFRISEPISIGLEMRQLFFLSDNIDGYNPQLPSNKNKDMASDVKFTISYYFTKGLSSRGKWQLD